jgi:uncharacterized membrane protein YhaH (DUF805 family)
MNNANPYETPEASLDVAQQEFYQPKIFSFYGRIGRLRYLAYGISAQLILMLIFLPLIGGLTALSSTSGEMSILSIIVMVFFYIALFVLTIMFAKRRLNDLNRSGWWSVLFFVPLLNLLITIYVIFWPGTLGTNEFGPAPVENSLPVKIFGFILPVIFIVAILAAIAIPSYQEYVTRAQEAQMQQQ